MKWLARLKESLHIWRRFWPQLAEHLGAMLRVLVLSLLVSALAIVRPWTMAWFFDQALLPVGEPQYEPSFVLWTSVGAFVLIVGSRVALDYLRNLSVVAVGHSVTRGLRHRIFGHLIRLSPSFHQQHKSGDLLMRLMGDVPMLKSMLVESTVELISRIALIGGTLAVMFWQDAYLTGILCLSLPLFVLAVKWISSHITIAVRKQRRKEGELADYLHEAIAGADAIQSLGRSEHVIHEFARSNRRSVRAGMKVAKLSAKLGASVEAMIALATAMTFLLGGFRVLDGSMSAGVLLVFLSYVRGLLKPVRAASKHAERISKGTACGERVLAVLDSEIEVADAPNAVKAPTAIKTLSYEKVSHQYAEGAAALNKIDLVFRQGELTGVFGVSGAGKSTLAALAVRLFDPSSGSVRINGTDIRDFKVASLRDRIGLCMQENLLFGESIAENLALGKPESSSAEQWTALERAGADDFVRALPGGLDTVLGSQGKGLSGGQRRRLVLARTLLRGAAILVVDEPFSGLDRVVAERVHRTLRDYARTRVVVVIAHEQEHLPRFDRIVFLEEGHVSAAGSHEELLQTSDSYKRIIEDPIGVNC